MASLKLYPAIDMLGGKAVRLVKGDFDAQTVYDEDPLSAASEWVAQGARQLHVVDLDGARDGHPINLNHLRRIAELGVPVQFGGGLRTLAAIEDSIDAGAERAILGTAAFTDRELLEEALDRWPGRVLVSLDVRGGRIATQGWTETVDGSPREVIELLASCGARELVYTNVDRDGMLQGPNVKELRSIADAARDSDLHEGGAEEEGGSREGGSGAGSPGKVVYSGGIGTLAHLRSLARMRHPALDGVIVGKALYERLFTVGQALTALTDL